MADTKISDLTALAAADVADSDLYYVVDAGTPNLSKKITAANLAQTPQFTKRYTPINGQQERPDWNVMRPGWYWIAYSGSVNTTAMTADRMYLVQSNTVRADCTADRITFTIDVAGSAGSVIRVGLYSQQQTDNAPITLLLDSGTVVATSTGTLEVTISQALTRGTRYYIALVAQGGAVTQPIVRHSSATQGAVGIATAFGATTNRAVWYMNSVSGALPATYTESGAYNDNAAPSAAVRIA